MTKKLKVVLMSTMTIMLCMVIITASTFSLFTDSATVSNHLVAGELDVELHRTALTHYTLNDKGYLAVNNFTEGIAPDGNSVAMDFSGENATNIFGFAEGTKIIPGSYYEATLEVRNLGNIAFNYNIDVKTNDAAKELAKHISILVTKPDGSTTTIKLSELTAGVTIPGATLDNDVKVSVLKVKVLFDETADNAAQNENASFDLVVSAVQVTPQK